MFEIVRLNRKSDRPTTIRKRTAAPVDSIFQQAYDALIAREIHQQFQLVDYTKWNEIEECIEGIEQYAYRAGENAIQSILGVLYDVASRARKGMPRSVASSINSICRAFIYPLNSLHAPPESWPAKMASLIDYSAAIGAELAYDGSLYLNDGYVFFAGCSILWRSMRAAVETGDKKLIKKINAHYRLAIDGASRSDLQYSTMVIKYQKQFARSKTKGPISYPDHYHKIPWVIWE